MLQGVLLLSFAFLSTGLSTTDFQFLSFDLYKVTFCDLTKQSETLNANTCKGAWLYL